MQITEKDQLREGDDAKLSSGKAGAAGTVTRVIRNHKGVKAIHLDGHPERFLMNLQAEDADDWGRRVWQLEDAQRPEPEITAGMVGNAVIRMETGLTGNFVRGTWVFRSGTEDDLVFRPHRPLGGVAQVHPKAVMAFTADPNWKDAVDAYARHVQRIRAAVSSSVQAHRDKMLAIIDDGPVPAAKPAPLQLSRERLTSAMRDAVDRINAGATVYASQPELLARAVEMLLQQELGIEPKP